MAMFRRRLPQFLNLKTETEGDPLHLLEMRVRVPSLDSYFSPHEICISLILLYIVLHKDDVIMGIVCSLLHGGETEIRDDPV